MSLKHVNNRTNVFVLGVAAWGGGGGGGMSMREIQEQVVILVTAHVKHTYIPLKIYVYIADKYTYLPLTFLTNIRNGTNVVVRGVAAWGGGNGGGMSMREIQEQVVILITRGTRFCKREKKSLLIKIYESRFVMYICQGRLRYTRIFGRGLGAAGALLLLV